MGISNPIFTWIKNTSVVQSGNHIDIINSYTNSTAVAVSKLIFTPLSIGDDGVYTCYVNNTHGWKLRAVLTISKLAILGYCFLTYNDEKGKLLIFS